MLSVKEIQQRIPGLSPMQYKVLRYLLQHPNQHAPVPLVRGASQAATALVNKEILGEFTSTTSPEDRGTRWLFLKDSTKELLGVSTSR